MTFPYRAYEVQPTPAHPNISTIYRPVIPVRIIGAQSDAVVLGLLDTGADETVLPAFLIKQLGIDVDPDSTAHFRGIGGQFVTVSYGAVELEVGIKKHQRRWTATVGFLDGPSVAILGHLGFLEYFRAAFDHRRREITLREGRVK